MAASCKNIAHTTRGHEINQRQQAINSQYASQGVCVCACVCATVQAQQGGMPDWPAPMGRPCPWVLCECVWRQINQKTRLKSTTKSALSYAQFNLSDNFCSCLSLSLSRCLCLPSTLLLTRSIMIIAPTHSYGGEVGVVQGGSASWK